MRIQIKIVQNEAERRQEAKDISRRIMHGKIAPNRHTIIVTPELFAKIFSPRRLDILILLAKNAEHNVSELAKLLKRKFEVVYRDLKLLEQFGLVKLTKETKSTIPELIGEIRLPVIS